MEIERVLNQEGTGAPSAGRAVAPPANRSVGREPASAGNRITTSLLTTGGRYGYEASRGYVDEGGDAGSNECTVRASLKDESQTATLNKTIHQDDQRLRLVLESTDDIVVMQDLDGRCVYYHGPREYGLKDTDMQGKVATDVLDAATAASITVRVRHVATTGQGLAFEQRVERKGKTFWFLGRISPVFDDNGQVTATVLVARNITVRKRAEESLRAANILLERTFAGLNEAVFVIHPSLRTITTCNAAV